MVVGEAAGAQCLLLGEESAKGRHIDDRAPLVAGQALGTGDDVADALRASSGNEESAKAFAGVTVAFVKRDLAFHRVEAAGPADGFGCRIELKEKAQRSGDRFTQRPGTVGIESLITELECEGVLAMEVREREPFGVGGDHHVHEEFRERRCVRLPRDADLGKDSAAGELRIVSVEDAVALRRQREVEQPSGAGRGRGPRMQPALVSQNLAPRLDEPLSGERVREGRRELQDLQNGEGRPLQSGEEVDVPRGDKTDTCHARFQSLPCSPFATPVMPPDKPGFINVDELLPQLRLEDVARFYGVMLPELSRVGSETRARCFLNCGRTTETGDRALAIQTEHPAKQWACHQYGCGKNGNLVSLCDLLKPGANTGGRPRGQRFKEIAADLVAMSRGEVPAGIPAAPAVADAPSPEALRVNVPLAQSPNERARTLTTLDAKFTLDVATMPPAASSYLRRRSFLTPEVCRAWRVGYLPRDTGEDKAGGTMRGKVVYPYLSETGELLTWFGRDPGFEEKHKTWEATDRSEREPEKFHFVKGFHRGVELFGQHRLSTNEGTVEKLRGLGLLLVEGPNDCIRMATLGVPALALCSNQITREQAAKAARLGREYADGIVTIFLDCDSEGENGMKQCLGYLAQLTPVRLAWTSKMYGGKFKGRQPESLRIDEWQEIAAFLRTGNTTG